MIGGYSDVAAEITRHFGRPYRRQHIESWNRRRTVNRAGQMFPSPVTMNQHPLRTRPRLLFDSRQVIAWMEGGIPGPSGKGWKDPRE
jgi:hypothetical protein